MVLDRRKGSDQIAFFKLRGERRDHVGRTGGSIFARKLIGVSLSLALVGALIGLYVADWATSYPRTVASSVVPPNSEGQGLTLETVASIGSKVDSTHPSWVSYLIRQTGRWVHSTDWNVPANTLIHGTIYQFDTPTGLRN